MFLRHLFESYVLVSTSNDNSQRTLNMKQIKISNFSINLAIIIGLYSFAGNINAKPLEEVRSNVAVGISNGWVIGNGFVFRKYIANYYTQATISGFANRKENSEYADLSLTVGHYFHHMKFTSSINNIGIKSILGVEVLHDKTEIDDSGNRVTKNSILTGLGLGMEIGNIHNKGVSVSMNILYAATYSGFRSREFTSIALRPSMSAVLNF